MEKKKLALITMGCSKNLVDSERVKHMLEDAGYVVEHNPENITADEVVINTCGFIGDAKEESVDMILQCVQAKKEGYIGGISVMGCLSERYRKELANEVPEVDRWYGKFDWTDLADELKAASEIPDEFEKVNSGIVKRTFPEWERSLTTPAHYTYLKISEGCNRFCAFCAIPLITGRHKSRPMDEIISEVESLTAKGVKEFNVIAQDLSSYGTDLYGHHALAELIDRMAGVHGVGWIRLHYAYPSDFPYDILPVMAKHPNVCKYLDIALQHCSDTVLANMRRKITSREQSELLARIRREVPGIHIRTTLMVGFPGEGPDEFEELLRFVKEQRFERMGAFAYCEEEDTFGARNFKDSVTPEEKQSRLDRLMEAQEEISMELNRDKIGRLVKVLVDSENEEYYVARTEWDSPEVDPEVLIRKDGRKLQAGEFAYVNIVDAMPYELIAETL